MNGETYGVKDMDKLVTDFEDVESIAIHNLKLHGLKLQRHQSMVVKVVVKQYQQVLKS